MAIAIGKPILLLAVLGAIGLVASIQFLLGLRQCEPLAFPRSKEDRIQITGNGKNKLGTLPKWSCGTGLTFFDTDPVRPLTDEIGSSLRLEPVKFGARLLLQSDLFIPHRLSFVCVFFFLLYERRRSKIKNER